jgi:glycerol dehydrogenase
MAMLSVFCSPSRYTQGKDATQFLGQEMTAAGLGGPALIVAGKSAIALLSEAWERSLTAAATPYKVCAFRGECSLAEIERVKAEARREQARVIIGAGGGKALDTARAAAADLNLPVVTCPSIASSDAPCSAISIVYTDDGVFQECRMFPKNPALVLVDTQVIARSPARMLVAGMGDALSTWFEAKACAQSGVPNMRGGASTRSALALAELCYRTLLEDGVDALAALQTQSVTPALERIVEANTLLSGLGFESSGLAAAHSIHNGLTAVPETRAYLHGEKVAFGVLVQLVLEGQPRSTIEEVLRFSTLIGLPVRLSEIGIDPITPDALERIAARSTAKGETIHNEPFEVRAESVADAIRVADEIGREWRRNGMRAAGAPTI